MRWFQDSFSCKQSQHHTLKRRFSYDERSSLKSRQSNLELNMHKCQIQEQVIRKYWIAIYYGEVKALFFHLNFLLTAAASLGINRERTSSSSFDLSAAKCERVYFSMNMGLVSRKWVPERVGLGAQSLYPKPKFKQEKSIIFLCYAGSRLYDQTKYKNRVFPNKSTRLDMFLKSKDETLSEPKKEGGTNEKRKRGASK